MQLRFKQSCLLSVAAIITTLSFSTSANAAAFQFYELGAPVIGTAGVGQAALANDASTAYYNPAGMARLPSTEFMLGTQVGLSYTNFSPNSSNTIAGNNGGNAGALVPGADAYFVYNASPKLKIGASITSPYGGLLDYTNHWVGRYIVQQMLLLTLNLNPALAYQINDCVAVGAGISIEYASLYQTVAAPSSPTVDGQATFRGSNTSPGFNLGILFNPAPATKIGVAYRSQIIHNLRGDIDLLNYSATPSASTKLVMPANVIASISQDIANQFVLLGEVGWANWSSMVNTIVSVHNFSVVTPQNWNNTYRLGVGGQFKATPAMLLQGGVSYDSSPTSSSKRTPNLPMDRQIRVGVGAIYAMLKAVNLGLSYEYINLGRAPINNTSFAGVLSGQYSRNYMNVVQASLNINL